MKSFSVATLLATSALLSAPLPASSQHTDQQPLSVRDVVEAPEFVELGRDNSYTNSIVRYSPGRQRYTVLVKRRDVATNKVFIDIFTGALLSSEMPVPTKVATLVSDGLGSYSPSGYPSIAWLGDDAFALRWRDAIDTPGYVARVDLQSGKVDKLTDDANEITDFAATRDGQRVVYAIASPQERWSVAPGELRSGLAVTVTNLAAVGVGDFDGLRRRAYFNRQVYIRTLSDGKVLQVHGPEWDALPYTPSLSIAPNGRWAIGYRQHPFVAALERGDKDAIAPWLAYQGGLAVHRESARDLAGFGYRQAFLIDLQTGLAKPLPGWENAPFASNLGTEVVWSPDSETIAVGPIYEPVKGASLAGMRGAATAIIDVRTGRWKDAASAAKRDGAGDFEYRPAEWRSEGTLKILGWSYSLKKEDNLNLRRIGVSSRLQFAAGLTAIAAPATPFRFGVDQGYNRPPELYVENTVSGARRTILSPVRQYLANYTLGCAFQIDATRLGGTDAVLYLPPNFRKGVRYPLVVQPYGYFESRFSLVGPSGMSGFAARALANRGIIVVQLSYKALSGKGTPAEPIGYTLQGVGVVRYLSKMGIVDPSRVGITGFSRTGWYAAYAISHPELFPFAAAVTADNIDGGYVQSVVNNTFFGEFATDNGGPIFGEGLNEWLKHAPGFNVDKIGAPLMMQVFSASDTMRGALQGWELFSRLRALERPVEFLLFKDGDHRLENPVQQYRSQLNIVDWYDFWLNGHVAGDDPKYTRWKAMKQVERHKPDPDFLRGDPAASAEFDRLYSDKCRATETGAAQ